MVPTAHFFTACPHARLVRGDDLTCQVAEKGLREVVAPGIIQQLFVVVCTRGPEPCITGTSPDTAGDTAAGSLPDTSAGPPPGSPAETPPSVSTSTPPGTLISPGFNPRFRLADPSAAPHRPSSTKDGRVKPGSTPPRRRRRGKPRLQTTLWLEGEIGKLANLYDYDHLYQEWLRRYTAEVGQAPVDTWRSFHNTAAACIRRILGA
ncbi:MAG: hypothetical protein U0X20_03415 [Caldilineaceae bacterium]